MSLVTLPDYIYVYRKPGFDGEVTPTEHMGTYCYRAMKMNEDPDGPFSTCREGLYLYHIGVPDQFPEKFVCEAKGVGALNIAKSLTASFIGVLPLRGLESFIFNWNKTCRRILLPWYLRPDLNCRMSKEIKMFVFIFLRTWGISFLIAYNAAQTIQHFFEQDIGYRYPLQDLAENTYQGELRKNPRGILNRLAKLYISRSYIFTDDKEGGGNKVKMAIGIMGWLLWIPKVRRCFNAALDAINFNNIKPDIADKFHCMLLGDYDYFGLTFAQRWENYKFLFPDGKYPPRIGLNI
jgi:hypothetical protein